MKKINLVALFVGALMAVGIAGAIAADVTEQELMLLKASVSDNALATRLKDELNFLDDVTATAAEVNFIAGVPASLDFFTGSLTTNLQGVLANRCDLSAAITVTGAAVGDTCEIGDPNDGTQEIVYRCFVSATSAVKIQQCNVTATNIQTGTSGTYKVRVWDS